MKKTYLLVIFFLLSTLLKAQNVDFDKKITLNQHSGTTQYIHFKDLKLDADSNTTSEPVKLHYTDSLTHNMYGDLLNDDPQYNPKSPLWRPIIGVVIGNFVTCAFNRYILNSDYCKISFQTVKNNWNNGWEWDSDRFGVNFIQHPYSGALSYNSARVREYTFYESVPFAFGGSLMWEQTMENTRPSFNDLINTTFTSSFLGEIMFRLSSNILDDRRSGGKRALREILAALMDPPRFIERLETGKIVRVTLKEVYQKEPVNISVYTGVKNVNDGTSFWKGENSAIFNFNIIYGNPFEDRNRKPFDFWRVRGDVTLGAGRKIIDNLMGYGIIFGTNIKKKNADMLFGLFQNYDYWDSKLFELATLGLGGGIFHRLQMGKTTDLVTQIHLGVVPLAGVSSPHVQEVDRNYNYAGGLQGMIEAALNLGGLRTTITAAYYIYGLHNYVGVAGNSITGIFRPKIAVKVLSWLSVGFEFLQYGKDSYFHDFPDEHVRNNEQRVYIMLDSGYFRF
jgi:hypothetical protein